MLATACAGATFAAPAPAAVPSFRIEVSASADTLAVEASFPAASAETLVLEDGGERFLRDVEVEQQGQWVSVRNVEQGVALPACTTGCHLKYRFLLRSAAEALADPQSAAVYGGGFVSPPSTWLLHPKERALSGYRLQVHTPDGVSFLSGLPPASGPGTYQSTSGLKVTPLAAFGQWRVRSLDVGGSHVTLAVAAVPFAMGEEDFTKWVSEATEAVAAYYRRFPVEQLLLLLVPDRGQHLSGFTLGEGGASILLRVGTRLPAPAARAHWVLTHELMHLGFPSLRRNHLWMEEGMAVFAEPLVRVRAGMVDEGVVWSEWMEQGPLGLPHAGQGGLETTHTWARTYWGGAIFWLVLDVTLRERTGNTRSADDILRALVSSGGNVTSRWEAEEVIRVADAAAGVPVFSELFHRFAEAPGAPDLDALFQKLGVSLHGDAVAYDDAAPLANVRRAMVGRGH
jgi:hypothetical protein